MLASSCGCQPHLASLLRAARAAWVSISPSRLARHVQSLCPLRLLTAAHRTRCGRGAAAVPVPQPTEATRAGPGMGCSGFPTPFLGVSPPSHPVWLPTTPVLPDPRRVHGAAAGLRQLPTTAPDHESIVLPGPALPAGIAALSKQETLALC